MSVKLKTSLFRDLLYLHEVIRHKQISAAAQKNGIKASNLSTIIKNLEKLSGKKLFIRHSNGLVPTADALKLDKRIFLLEEYFNQTAQAFLTKKRNESILLYLPENFRFDNLEKFTREHACVIKSVDTPEQADVIVSCRPVKNPEMIIVENTVGDPLRQTIWIASVNEEKALLLAESLITALHGRN